MEDKGRGGVYIKGEEGRERGRVDFYYLFIHSFIYLTLRLKSNYLIIPT